MSLELQILKLITKDKETFHRYRSKLEELSLEREVNDLFRLICKYYETYTDHTFISKDELLGFYDFHYSASKNKDFYHEIIKRIYSLDTSDSLASDVLSKLIEKHAGNKIVQQLLPLLSGETSGILVSIKDQIKEYEEILQKQDAEEISPFVEDDLEELIEQCTTDGMSWRLRCLNEDLGQLPGNTLGHFFAVPDAGKTSFIHSEVAFFIGQLEGDQNLIWFNNEEGSAKIKLRFYSAVCNATKQQVLGNVTKAKQVFSERGGYRMRLRDRATITVDEIEKLSIDWKARIAIVDIGDKVQYRGRGATESGPAQLQGVYDNLREVVKRVNKHHKFDMLTTGQAGITAENQQWLKQSDLYGGKTGKAGAFDYIIGMGWLLDQPTRRFIHCCKNKLGDQSGRHVVNFNPLTARFSD